jgi:uncharacterized protein
VYGCCMRGMLDLIRRCDVVLLMVDVTDSPVRELEETAAFLEQHNIISVGGNNGPADQRTYEKPFLALVNKVDTPDMIELYELFLALLEKEWHTVPISAQTGWNTDEFKQTLFQLLKVIRVYSKAPDREPDLNQPFVLQEGSSVEEFAGRVHKDFVDKMRSARV